MDSLLKGNYTLNNEPEFEADQKSQTASAVFEEEAMRRLGGSIAFVMKGNQLVWDDEPEATEPSSGETAAKEG